MKNKILLIVLLFSCPAFSEVSILGLPPIIWVNTKGYPQETIVALSYKQFDRIRSIEAKDITVKHDCLIDEKPIASGTCQVTMIPNKKEAGNSYPRELIVKTNRGHVRAKFKLNYVDHPVSSLMKAWEAPQQIPPPATSK